MINDLWFVWHKSFKWDVIYYERFMMENKSIYASYNSFQPLL